MKLRIQGTVAERVDLQKLEIFPEKEVRFSWENGGKLKVRRGRELAGEGEFFRSGAAH